jgi:hypothetical protein
LEVIPAPLAVLPPAALLEPPQPEAPSATVMAAKATAAPNPTLD